MYMYVCVGVPTCDTVVECPVFRTFIASYSFLIFLLGPEIRCTSVDGEVIDSSHRKACDGVSDCANDLDEIPVVCAYICTERKTYFHIHLATLCVLRMQYDICLQVGVSCVTVLGAWIPLFCVTELVTATTAQTNTKIHVSTLSAPTVSNY